MRSLLVLVALGATASQPEDLNDQMHQHLALATAARDAVIHGDLDAVHMAGRDLVALPTAPDFPDAWRPMLAETKAVAERLHIAPDLKSAGEAIGELGITCAGCHAQTGGGPDLASVPAQKWAPNQHMPLHKWSADWMWLGLIAGDAEAWKRGGRELGQAEIKPRFRDDTPPEGFTQLEQLVRIIGSMAAEKELDEVERGKLYGQFVGVCAQCHLKMSAAGRK